MEIKGVVDYIIFPREKDTSNNGFVVFKLKCLNNNELNKKNITVTGYSNNLSVGMNVTIKGELINHPKYGDQIKASLINIEMPTSKENIERVLINNVKGIGKVTAHKICEKFGQSALEILRKTPEAIMELNLGDKKSKDIINNLKSFFDENDNVIRLQEKLGLSSNLANRICKKFKNNDLTKIEEDPYILIENIDGIGFKKADEIAQKIGFDKNSYHRIKEGVIYCLQDSMKNGHIYLSKKELIKRATSLLELDNKSKGVIESIINNSYEIVNEENKIYLSYAYYTEKKIGDNLKRIHFGNIEDINTTNELIIHHIERFEKEQNIKLSENQRNAIYLVLRNKISIITGGPGTGKTTITKGIISIYKELFKKEVILTSPTGRAAKRLREATGMEAHTIHRLLDCSVDSRGNIYFKKNEKNRLSGGLLLVDESSMIDNFLMKDLLKAIPDHMKVVFVGDVDQLPAVGPGNVLKSMIESGQIPVAILSKIYRQGKNSLIVENSHRINNGQNIISRGNKDYKKDFIYIRCDNDEEIEKNIYKIIDEKLSRYEKIDIIKDVQILTPMKRGLVGLNNLNKKIQDLINTTAENKRELNYCGIIYRERDKVMQIGNNYNKKVFNGDCGIIKYIDPIHKKITVVFEEVEGDKEIIYTENEIKQITPSYAITIHKSQGSEFPIVIIPICKNHTILLQRNLLYTALTRAKKLAILIAEDKALKFCIRNNKIQKRNTNLSNILRKLYTEEENRLINNI